MRSPPERSFLDELKRRKVVRVGLVYLAVSWAVVEAADVFVPALRLSEWIVTAVAVAALLGLPVAVALAWAFDVTPEGVRRSADSGAPDARGLDPSGQEPPVHEAPVAWLSAKSATVTGTMVAVALLTGWLFGTSTAREASATALDAFGPSIAVLPLENVSGDAARAPFVVGLHDDLLTQLGTVSSIRVTSRTSLQSYTGSGMPIAAIAAELRVATVLEGSVHADEQQIRLNVRLLDGATGDLLWAESYDRDLSTESIFAVQSEIAEEITRALRATLTPRERTELARVETESLEAYQAFLDASVLGVRGAHYIAEQHLERAVALDPEYGAAWARLAMVRSWIYRVAPWSKDVSSLPALRDRATEALQKARALAPASHETLEAEAYYENYVTWDIDAALERAGRALTLAPNNADVISIEAGLLARKGRYGEALRRLEAASALDPRAVELHEMRATLLSSAGRFEEAKAVVTRGLILDPSHLQLSWVAIGLEWLMGAHPSLDSYPGVVGDLDFLEIMALWGGDPVRVDAYTRALRDQDVSAATRLAGLLWASSLVGDPARRIYADSLIPIVEPLLREPEIGSERIALARLRTVLALAYEARGSRARTIQLADEALALVEPPFDQKAADDDVRSHVVQLYAITGDAERALPLIEELLPRPGFHVENLRAALFDRIRDDPRMQALLERHAREGDR